MASNKMRLRQSLAVLPRNYVIMAQRISMGGELILVRKPSIEPMECEQITKKGRVCVQGPLGDLIKIKAVNTKQIVPDAEDCFKIEQGRRDSVIVKSAMPSTTMPCTTFPYQQLKLDVRSLHFAIAKNSVKEELKSTEVAKSSDKQQQLIEPITGDESMKSYEQAVSSQYPIPTYDTNVEDGTLPEEGPSQGGKFKNKLKISEMSVSSIDSRNARERGRHQIDRFENVAAAPIHNVSRFSIIVKWKHHPNIPCYTMRSVFEVLSKYGKIVAMGQLSINSCLVLFHNFHTSVLVVRDSLIGPKAYPLICMWYYPQMQLDSIALLDIHPYKKSKIISEEAKWLHQYHEMQEQVISCFKSRGISFSYDRSVFNP